MKLRQFELRYLVCASAGFLMISTAGVLAQTARPNPFGNFGGNSKEPIRIDANKLEVFDKENKAIYSGDVIAVRGATTTRATTMIIFYESRKEGSAVPRNQAAAGQDGNLKRIELKGPVSVVNGTQTATANEMIYDAAKKEVTLKGNAIVADGPNIQRGELMVYNTDSSVVSIVTPGGRVQGIFTPSSQGDAPRRR
jgi:lipopolysaccharide export system protein LptA